MRWFYPLLMLPLVACAADGQGPGAALNGEGSDADNEDCSYPEGAAEPMALGEVLSPYAWPSAVHGDGTDAPLDLQNAACDSDSVLDWSPFDVLLFVSLPAW